MSMIPGFLVTLRQIFKRKVTIQYPEQKRSKPQRFHGRHVLNRYPDGMEKCIGCELCAGVCPARCIYVRGKENPADEPISPGERYGFVYEINMLRCIFCALCRGVPHRGDHDEPAVRDVGEQPRRRDLHP